MLTPNEYEIFCKKLIEKGYTRYNQDWKRSDVIYWKSFDVTYDIYDDKEIGYQVGFAIYDYSNYPNYKHPENKIISISFNLLLGHKIKIDRLDLEITDSKMSIDEFEQFCKEFYNSELINKLKKES
jgi:hypothetical protein